MSTPETLWYGSVLYGIRRQFLPILRRGGGVCLMGFFEDRSKDAYDRAAEQGRLKDKKGWF